MHNVMCQTRGALSGTLCPLCSFCPIHSRGPPGSRRLTTWRWHGWTRRCPRGRPATCPGTSREYAAWPRCLAALTSKPSGPFRSPSRPYGTPPFLSCCRPCWRSVWIRRSSPSEGEFPVHTHTHTHMEGGQRQICAALPTLYHIILGVQGCSPYDADHVLPPTTHTRAAPARACG